MATDITDILSKLHRVRRVAPAQWVACCPAHRDASPSLSVGVGADGRLLLHCFAGCGFARILESIGAPVASAGFDVTGASSPAASSPELELLWRRYETSVNHERFVRFARSLGLEPDSLRRLGIGYDLDRRCWAFPMRDADSKVRGIRLRTEQGRKFSVTGGHEGLFVPRDLPDRVRTLFLPEGPTSAAALLEMGAWAMGRPSCTGGNRLAIDLVARYRPDRVVVVGDNDQETAAGIRPGLHGAVTLARLLRPRHPDVCYVLPPLPFKDCRDWYIAGARLDQLRERVRWARWLRKGVVA